MRGRDGEGTSISGGEDALGVPIDPDLPSPVPRVWGRYVRTHPAVLAVIAAGGALGAAGRYAVAGLLPVHPDAFPWATFATNTSGSFLLGLGLIVLIEHFPPTRYLRPFAATGVLGAFTTYSTFAVETDLLVRAGRPVMAVLYAVVSLTAGFAAAWGGILAARLLPRRNSP